MKVTCPISHISYRATGMACGSIIAPHPLLNSAIPFKELKATYMLSWAAGKLTATETHLLGTALLLKLPIEGTPQLPELDVETYSAFWAVHIERLARTVEYLDGRDFKYLPKLRMTGESISNLQSSLTAIMDAAKTLWTPTSEEAKRRNSLLATNPTIALKLLNSRQELTRSYSDNSNDAIHAAATVEEILNRGLKGSPLTRKEQKTFPALIANWAAQVGSFPSAVVTLDTGKKVSISQLWKGIIEQAFQKDITATIFTSDTNIGDVEELLEHCYTEVPTGTLHASELFKKLEVLKDILDEFKGGDKPIQASDSDLLAMLEDAPAPVVTTSDDGLTAAQRLAVRMAAMKAGKKVPAPA